MQVKYVFYSFIYEIIQAIQSLVVYFDLSKSINKCTILAYKETKFQRYTRT